MDAAELRRGIGYVIQHAGLFPHRTVLDNVATVPRLLGWDKKQTARRARWSCSSASASTRRSPSATPAQLSGGQQQRVGVARALAADPPVMLMDEPFSAVDPVVREQLQDEFLRLQAELGKTILFVTHDIDEAIKLGDQVAVLRVGGVLAQLAEPAIPARATRSTTSWPASSAATAATARWASHATPDLQLTDRADGRARRHRRRGAGREQRRRGCSSSTTTASRSAGSSRTASAATSTATMLHRGGTVARVHGPAARRARRRALLADAAAASSSTTTGVLAGTVRADQVLTVIEHDRAPGRRRRRRPVRDGRARS